jgi:hypothetical protein
MYKFVIWKRARIANAAQVEALLNVPNVYELKYGASAVGFPTNAAFRMNPDYKRNTTLIDSVFNVEAMMLCSERLKDAIEAFHPPKVEYLPVTILDHKSKAVPEKYFIVHPIDPPDCIDLNKSDLEWSDTDKESILGIDSLVIDEKKIGPDRLVLRPKRFNQMHLVRRDLAEKLAETGFTGFGFGEINQYSS